MGKKVETLTLPQTGTNLTTQLDSFKNLPQAKKSVTELVLEDADLNAAVVARQICKRLDTCCSHKRLQTELWNRRLLAFVYNYSPLSKLWFEIQDTDKNKRVFVF